MFDYFYAEAEQAENFDAWARETLGTDYETNEIDPEDRTVVDYADVEDADWAVAPAGSVDYSTIIPGADD